MRSKTPEALKSPRVEVPLPIPQGPYVIIPTKNLLGYRGTEEFYKAAVTTLPGTFDGKPVLSYDQLEMRPLKDQLSPARKSSSLFPKEMLITPPAYDNRPLVERLQEQVNAKDLVPLPLEAAQRIHQVAETKKKAS